MPQNSQKLINARRNKDDEFYTPRADIDAELKHYERYFRDKVVYLPCDNPATSQFVKYFIDNFQRLGIRKLICNHYNPITKKGDCFRPYAIRLLRECDIIVTNPPFSLFNKFFKYITAYDKKYLIIGAMGGMSYKDVLPKLADGKLWSGTRKGKNIRFLRPDGTYKNIRAMWYTNMKHPFMNKPLPLTTKYSPYLHPKINNQTAINVSSIRQIPMDYDETMAVPINFLELYNHSQFVIFKVMDNLQLGTKSLYRRVLIKRRASYDPNMPNCFPTSTPEIGRLPFL